MKRVKAHKVHQNHKSISISISDLIDKGLMVEKQPRNTRKKLKKNESIVTHETVDMTDIDIKTNIKITTVKKDERLDETGKFIFKTPHKKYDFDPQEDYFQEYDQEYFDYIHQNQQKVKPYFENQADINEKMRLILFDWLVDVHVRFKLEKNTLFYTFSFIDRFLQMKNVSRSRLQLVGVTCSLLACKFEEIYAPSISDYVYITDRAYTKQELIKMEISIVNNLSFDLAKPTLYHFLGSQEERILKVYREKRQHVIPETPEDNQIKIAFETEPMEKIRSRIYHLLLYFTEHTYLCFELITSFSLSALAENIGHTVQKLCFGKALYKVENQDHFESKMVERINDTLRKAICEKYKSKNYDETHPFVMSRFELLKNEKK